MTTKTANTAPDEQEKEQKLPQLTDGELVSISTVRVVAKKTRAPSRYTEGTLLGDMENAGKYLEEADASLRAILKQVNGLGTAATRDSVIETLKHHKYLEKSGKHLAPTEKGVELVLYLEKVCPELVDVAMTARWEAELDMIAKKGGGLAFEKKIEQKIRDLVAILKNSPPIESLAASSKTTENNMSENGEKRTNPPTPKMLEYATSISKRLGVKLPDDLPGDFDACRAFIDAHKDAASAPSEKQIKFAKSISERTGVDIPADALANGKVLSKWIDDNK